MNTQACGYCGKPTAVYYDGRYCRHKDEATLWQRNRPWCPGSEVSDPESRERGAADGIANPTARYWFCGLGGALAVARLLSAKVLRLTTEMAVAHETQGLMAAAGLVECELMSVRMMREAVNRTLDEETAATK